MELKKLMEQSLDRIRAKVRAIEGGTVAFGRKVAALGEAAIDQALPWGGLPFASLHEVAAVSKGMAASGFSAALARRFLEPGGVLLWCRNHRFDQVWGEIYGPGLQAYGLDPTRLVLVHGDKDEEILWATEEGLRCSAVACVVSEIDHLDLQTSRRLQLAAEAGGGAGLLLRPDARDTSPSATLTRWRISPFLEPFYDHDNNPAWHAELWRSKGGAPADWVVRWHEPTLSFAAISASADRTDDHYRQAAG